VNDVKTREIEGYPYYYFARIFANGDKAKRVFDSLQAEGARQKGKLDLGVYRSIKPSEGDEARILICVSLTKKGIEWAARVVGGIPYALPEVEADALMARRVRVVAPIYEAGEAKEGGQVVIRRGKRGAHLRPGGHLDERIGHDD